MRSAIPVIIFFFCGHYTQAQNFQTVDSIVATYPGRYWSPEKLANRIKTDFKSDSAKARAIFSWIAHHVAYDVKKYEEVKRNRYAQKTRKIPSSQVAAYRHRVAQITLRTKKGICGDYAMLFQRLCDLSGVECATISGAAKTRREQIGRFPVSNDHAWNAVMINGDWRLIDVTWGAGGLDEVSGKFVFRFDDSYFFTPSDLFFLKHYPAGNEWRDASQSDTAFASLPLYHHLDERIRILSPSGSINNKRREDIEFRIQADENMHWKYRYWRDKSRFTFALDHTFSNGIATFVVPPPLAMNDYLTIYCDGIPLATFRVKKGMLARVDFAGGRGR